ncbi:ABC transporter ATP-binding protein [Oceanobacillus massiliensis]|uniref:ABC transporter ATP-binding protein n=1 Tax=Oceanobacillus massiliensis TaxID=1465765 RepID=UPI0030194179
MSQVMEEVNPAPADKKAEAEKKIMKQASAKVELRNLVKKFGKTTAIRDVNLDIDSGEFMTLLGPSGCGKTTILSMILGIHDPTSGGILFNGEVINGIPMNKRDIGMVFQNYALFPHMTVAQNVAFGLDMRKTSKQEKQKRVAKALEMVQLAEFSKRFPKELSGGQQQRVALARALVIRPKVLLLDEPLSNLDAKLRKDMRIQLKRLHDELNITTIYVTHDQEEALSLSTKVAVMSRGIVQQIGTPREIFMNPRNKFVANFIGYSNFLEGKVEAEQGEHFVFRSEHGYPLLVKKNPDIKIGQEVLLTIKPENVKVAGELIKDSINYMSGRVLTSDYVGSTTSYEVLTTQGEIIRINVLGLEPYPLNTDIKLYLNPASILILNKG